MAQRVYNLLETLLWDEVEAVLPRYPDTCGCEQCRLDVYTLALNGLPPVYVTGKRFNNELRQTAHVKYLGQMHEAIRKAAAKVREKPRPECAKRLGFWISPDAPVQTNVLFPQHVTAVEGGEAPLTPSPMASTASKYKQYKPAPPPKRRY